MSYPKLCKLINIVNNQIRLIEYAKYYTQLEVKGLHYVTFIKESNTLAISRPDHTTHHEATSYLIIKKNEYPINTIKRQAYALKKFLDFLMIWEINLLQVDLFWLMQGFADYLRSISSDRNVRHTIEWSFVSKIPLHIKAMTSGKVAELGYSKEGFKEVKDWNELSFSTIEQIVGTAIQYLTFLKESTLNHKNLPINHLPIKSKYSETILSGTLRKKIYTIIDVGAILAKVGLKSPIRKESLLLRQKVFTLAEIDFFMNFIPSHHRQNRFLFYVLKWFGLRASEAANIMIDTTTIPKNLLFMEHFEAREYIRTHLRGDIEYSQHIDRWVCYVVKRKNEDFRSQHKSGSRDIPFLFSAEYFLDLLVDALREREMLMQYTSRKHSFLFVSLRSKGNPITGASIYGKYSNYASQISKQYDMDYTRFSPHSFRHFFATYLLRLKKIPISDVSRWLGHSSEEITRSTYSHYLPGDDDNKEIVKDMEKRFGDKED